MRKAKRVEAIVARRAAPSQGDPQEREHVGEIEPLVESLVVTDAAQIEQVHHEEV